MIYYDLLPLFEDSKTRLTLAVLEQQVPDAPPRVGVHPGRGLVQDHHLGAPHECYRHRQLPLHAPWGGEGSEQSTQTPSQLPP